MLLVFRDVTVVAMLDQHAMPSHLAGCSQRCPYFTIHEAYSKPALFQGWPAKAATF